MKYKLSKFICLLSILALLPIQMVFAGSAEGTYKETTVNGYRYKYRSTINNDSTKTVSGTTILSADRLNLPGGYMGASARLYNANTGTLVKSVPYVYNDSPSGGFNVLLTGGYTPRGSYYSWGSVQMWNGSGYYTYTCSKSPAISRTRPVVEVNENGEVYGSEILLSTIGVEPDLILAVGINGKEGYVKAEDLSENYEPSSPQEAIAYQKSMPSEKRIPVYEKDGTTVIDTFLVTKATVENVEY